MSNPTTTGTIADDPDDDYESMLVGYSIIEMVGEFSGTGSELSFTEAMRAVYHGARVRRPGHKNPYIVLVRFQESSYYGAWLAYRMSDGKYCGYHPCKDSDFDDFTATDWEIVKSSASPGYDPLNSIKAHRKLKEAQEAVQKLDGEVVE